MLIYKIPSDIDNNSMAIPDFTQAFLDVEETNPITDSCFFEIITANDSREHLYTSEYSYLVIPDYYDAYFQSLLSKYGAKKLNSLPSFNKVTVLAGDENAIDKAAR
ncbi:MAG: hypothetical protein A2V66_17245 [Ignavibacteria bacterium RBG_13_36_8]|nr:MAG: hypothetical protein A2V66_17245 [Ignavibacteria bacterium RBG_13_36_8]